MVNEFVNRPLKLSFPKKVLALGRSYNTDSIFTLNTFLISYNTAVTFMRCLVCKVRNSVEMSENRTL